MIQLKRILLPTDFSDYAAEAVKYACALAERFNAQLHVLHVIEFESRVGPNFFPDYEEQLKQDAEQALAHVPEREWTEGKDVVRTLTWGKPFLEIIRYAKEHQIDMIVLATHGRSGLSHILMGSVAERVVRQSPCPVLTVRPEGHQFVMP
jgi:nucleotide-binding universal stress UspA family protein